MENASKALIMAGAILIALIIISLGVLVFRNMSGSVERNANLTQQQIEAYNAKITPYLGNSVSGSQVNTLIQLATSINNLAIKNGDTAKRLSIYKGTGETDWYIKCGKNDTDVSYGTERKVTIGSFYKVSETFDNNGLITKINITQ